jgi:hypothetical protein
MDNPENTIPTSSSELEELKAQYEDLRHLVVSALVLVLVISGAFNLYLLRQWKFAKNDLTAVQPQANQIINTYVKESGGMQEFVRKLAEYGRTHPDFAPISAKYGLNNYLTKAGSAPVTAAPPPGMAAPGSQTNKK